MLEPPGTAGRRSRLGDMVAAQAVEDEGTLQAARGQGGYHLCNAVPDCVAGKVRFPMTWLKPEAAAAWLDRDRLHDNQPLPDGDADCAWTPGSG